MIPILGTIVSHPRKIVEYTIILFFIIMMGAQKTILGATQDFVINNGRLLFSNVHRTLQMKFLETIKQTRCELG